jgi:hypothetical protein
MQLPCQEILVHEFRYPDYFGPCRAISPERTANLEVFAYHPG